MSSQNQTSETLTVEAKNASEIANYVRAELAEGRDLSLTHAEALLLMAEYDRRGAVELGHE